MPSTLISPAHPPHPPSPLNGPRDPPYHPPQRPSCNSSPSAQKMDVCIAQNGGAQSDDLRAVLGNCEVVDTHTCTKTISRRIFSPLKAELTPLTQPPTPPRRKFQRFCKTTQVHKDPCSCCLHKDLWSCCLQAEHDPARVAARGARNFHRGERQAGRACQHALEREVREGRGQQV